MLLADSLVLRALNLPFISGHLESNTSLLTCCQTSSKYGKMVSIPELEVCLRKYVRSYLFLFLIAGVIIFLDQYTKNLVRENIPLWSGVWSPWDWLLPYARIIHIPNTGVAFGMFQNMGWLFTILSSLVALLIIFYFPRVPSKDWSLRLAMGLQLGGAVGNLIDRITIGHVTDFISVGNFAIFNIADASITVGVFVLILGVWWQERAEKNAAKVPAFHSVDVPLEKDHIVNTDENEAGI